MEEQKPAVRFRAILEVVGTPKAFVEKTLADYLEKIKKEPHLKLLQVAKEQPEEKEGYWGTFAELELEAEDIYSLTGFCFDYMPSSVEVDQPESLTWTCQEMTDYLTDLQGKLHSVDTIARSMMGDNRVLNKNFLSLLLNFVEFLLKGKAMTVAEISTEVGIASEKLTPMLDGFVNIGKLKKEGEQYVLSAPTSP
ncbi:hypothetical protein HZB01_05485 [Candidatus Woesearchaeota archaeon]|nr:hypothetical protein [Candidatus Woesearchaeota archaeon]